MSTEDAPTTVVDAVPRTPGVAVFGGDEAEALEPARMIGRWVVRRGCVVLTGGRGPAVEPDRPSVRKTAIEGAEREAEAGSPGSWAEVERNEDEQPDVEVFDTHVVLHPQFDHRRNYVEAHLCDVAIALPGEDGTRSEVAFCLELGRPVVLLGPNWQDDYERLNADRRVVQDRLAQAVDDRVLRRPLAAPWNPGLEDARRRLDDVTWPLPAVVHCDLPDGDEDAEEVVDTALDLLDLEHLPGMFPLFKDAPGYMDMARLYADWLARRAPFDPARIRRLVRHSCAPH
jgi:predicted Rossmann-fold nucleotide-binding protein